MCSSEQLKTNLKALNAPAAQVVQRDSLQWLDQRVEQPFDIIFLDPPFKQGLMQLAVDKLFINGIIKNQQAWLYLEQEKSLDWPNLPDGWVCHREKTTSQVRFGLFRQV